MKAHEKSRRKRRSSAAAASSTSTAAGEVTQTASSSTSVATKKVRLTNFDLFQFITKQKIEDLVQLLKLANKQHEQSKNYLAAFILNKTEKQLADIIKMTWRMQNAKTTVERKTCDRMDIIYNVQRNEKCRCDNDGDWYRLAIETLARNNVNKYVFSYSVRVDLLKKGRFSF